MQQELLDAVSVWADLETVQTAVDAFVVEYNTTRHHQSLGMAFPADRFTPRPEQPEIPLRVPATLSSNEPSSAPALPVQAIPAPHPAVPTSLVSCTKGVDPVNLTVQITRTVPASGNLAVCGQQFWLGPIHAGTPVTLWADTSVVHLLKDGARIKTVPSRLTAAHLRQLLPDGGQPAGPPPIPVGPATTGAPIEVDRLVNATGLISLAGRRHPSDTTWPDAASPCGSTTP